MTWIDVALVAAVFVGVAVALILLDVALDRLRPHRRDPHAEQALAEAQRALAEARRTAERIDRIGSDRGQRLVSTSMVPPPRATPPPPPVNR
jgi:hypothetical protein